MPAFVEFTLNTDRLPELVAVVQRVAAAKRSQDWPTDEQWLQMFDSKAREHFWWPTEVELRQWEREWFSTPVEERAGLAHLRRPWDFGSMLDALRYAEVEVLGVRDVHPGCYRLELEPTASPYGGLGCFRALVESFGATVVDEHG